MSTAPLSDLKALYAALLEDLASDVVPERQGREEPRAVRRECSHYPYLKVSRAAWRASCVA